MGKLRKLLAVSFRAKVLVPVIFVMICLLAVTAWVVNRRITKQFETEATPHACHSANAGLREWQEKSRRKSYAARARSAQRTALQSHSHCKPMPPRCAARFLDILRCHRRRCENRLAHFAQRQLCWQHAARRDPLLSADDFENAGSAEVVKRALRGEDTVGYHSRG